METLKCDAGTIYRIKYKLNGQRFVRYAQLTFLDAERDSGRSSWSGRPTIGTLTFQRGEIYEVTDVPEGAVKHTYFDKRSPQ